MTGGTIYIGAGNGALHTGPIYIGASATPVNTGKLLSAVAVLFKPANKYVPFFQQYRQSKSSPGKISFSRRVESSHNFHEKKQREAQKKYDRFDQSEKAQQKYD